MSQSKIDEVIDTGIGESCKLPLIDLVQATSLNEWCKMYRKKYGKNSTGAEQNHQLAIHPEWMDEYGRKGWESHQRREKRNGK